MNDQTLDKSENTEFENKQQECTDLPEEGSVTFEEEAEDNPFLTELDALKKQNIQLNDQYVRLAADFDNFRKRFAQERESLLKYGAYETVKVLIPLANNFTAALNTLDKISDVDKMKESFKILETQFQDILKEIGVEKIKTQGEPFSPELHQAVMQIETTEHPDQTVLDELQPGYTLKDKVLSVAYVTVAKNTETSPSEDT